MADGGATCGRLITDASPRGGAPALDELRRTVADHTTTTLLYAAHDEQHNQAVILQHLLTDAA